MVEYVLSKAGYVYKYMKNGDKIRVSRDEYNKKCKSKSKLTQKSITLRRSGGNPRTLDKIFNPVSFQTIGDCIKELIDASYKLYMSLLNQDKRITLVCGGQSPAYYCLAMMHFSIYNPLKVDIVILPHSKGGQETEMELQYAEDNEYCRRIREKQITLQDNVVILDGVHSGVGILALESALKNCFPSIKVTKIAINAFVGLSKIPVDMEIILPCAPKFSDIFPRLVTSYHPRDFSDSTTFITEFEIKDNPIAEMIIDIARIYPTTKVEDTSWFKLNNIITPEILLLKQKRLETEAEEHDKHYGSKTFNPIITNSGRYECPLCHFVSGTKVTNLTHAFNCLNKNKTPVVEMQGGKHHKCATRVKTRTKI